MSRISVSEIMIIPTRTVCNIVCKVAGSTVREGLTGILEPKQAFEERYQLGIVKKAAVFQKGQIPVRLFNPNESETKIWKGSSLGSLSPLLVRYELRIRLVLRMKSKPFLSTYR